MKPTNKLRFVQREIGSPFAVDGKLLPEGIMRMERRLILQQWWEAEFPYEDEKSMQGEWRDVPIEEETDIKSFLTQAAKG